jgi:hypothetical protein
VPTILGAHPGPADEPGSLPDHWNRHLMKEFHGFIRSCGIDLQLNQ